MSGLSCYYYLSIIFRCLFRSGDTSITIRGYNALILSCLTHFVLAFCLIDTPFALLCIN